MQTLTFRLSMYEWFKYEKVDLIMQCLFEKVNQFHLSLKSYQDTKIAKYFSV